MKEVRAILIRVGADQSKGGGYWNSPADQCTNEYIYFPIPEGNPATIDASLATNYSVFTNALTSFPQHCTKGIKPGAVHCPISSATISHLDPDFANLTYGDYGKRRGKKLSEFQEDDLIVFYAGLKPIHSDGEQELIYAIIGLYVIEEILSAHDFAGKIGNAKNAHTRKKDICFDDIVVLAKEGVSGRLEKYIEIGEFRDKAYRVKQPVLQAWGGLSVKDGYLQRSVNPPTFLDPGKFYSWFKSYGIRLIQSNV